MRILLIFVFYFFLVFINVDAQYTINVNNNSGCAPLNVEFQFVSSASVDTITSLLWDFGNGNIQNSNNENETISTTYSEFGRYTVKVYINNKSDSIVIPDYITVYPVPVADFNYFLLPDKPLSAYFTINSSDQNLYSYKYIFGDGDSSLFKNIVHTFPDAGNYLVSLYVTNEFNCSSNITKIVNISSPGTMPYISANPSIACDSAYVKFVIHNVDYDTISTIEWDFGNGIISNEVNPQLIFFKNLLEPKRSFSVSAKINNSYTILMNNLITIYRTVKAHFECPDSIVENNRIVKKCYPLDNCLDNSTNYSYFWEIDGSFYSSNKNIVLVFNQIPDTIRVKLTITNDDFGCTDSRTYTQYIWPELLVQNVFTPNGDGINDYFIIDSYGTIKLQIFIYSRTGVLVYYTEGTKLIWDGLTETGEKAPTGIYFYVIRPLISDSSGKFYKTGFVYLYR